MENQIVENNRVDQFLDRTGLNWKVRTEGLQTSSGIIIPDKIGIVREDDSTILGIHSNGYVPYQNDQMMELLFKVSQQTGLDVHRGGLFGGGRKVFVQLKSNDLALGTDRIEGYVTGINSFDGSTSLSFGPSSKTISCQNTFFGVYKDLNSKVRHTKNMELKIDDICRQIEGVVEEEKNVFGSIVKMSETRFDDIIKDRVIKSLFNIEKNVNIKDIDALSSVTQNKLSRFYVDLNGEIQGKGDNLWGLFSGVTKYTTHSMGKGDNSENKMFGSYGNRERQIFKELVHLV
jgi:phage/plasmid-like protein (TIGR03299 family)